MENDLLEIADDTDRDYREGKNGQEIPNKEVVLRSKIRIESRQWLMSRRDPRLWGDKQSLDVSANIMLLSPEERVQKALQLFDLVCGARQAAADVRSAARLRPWRRPAGFGSARPKEKIRARITDCPALFRRSLRLTDGLDQRDRSHPSNRAPAIPEGSCRPPAPFQCFGEEAMIPCRAR